MISSLPIKRDVSRTTATLLFAFFASGNFLSATVQAARAARSNLPSFCYYYYYYYYYYYVLLLLLLRLHYDYDYDYDYDYNYY